MERTMGISMAVTALLEIHIESIIVIFHSNAHESEHNPWKSEYLN